MPRRRQVPRGAGRVAMVAHWDWVLFNFRLPIARALQEQGLDVVLVCPAGIYSPSFAAQGFRWVEWRVERRSVNPIREWRAITHLKSIYDREQPDVAHHFTVKPNLYGSIAARLAKVPIVLNMFSGLGYVFSDVPRARQLRRMLLPLMRWAFAHPNTHMLVLNDPDLTRLRTLGLATGERSRIMPEGVDLDLFHPATPDEATDEPPIALIACRLLRDKGIPEFVSAAEAIRDSGVRARFWIAGEPDVGNPESVSEAEMKEWESRGAVEFLGNRSDMPELLQQVSVAVLPSRYKEGLPRFLLEGAACGLPLIGTDIGGVRDVIDDGRNGYLVPPGDTEALTARLREILTDSGLRAELGASSREIVSRRFGEDRVVSEHLRLYEDVGSLGATPRE